jgi:ABC-type transport system involved in cytochrome c biogenesis permease subunit
MLLEFDYTAMITFVLWLMGLVFFYFAENKRIQTAGLYILIAGIGLFTAYIANLWVFLDRAPLRTLGETRLWYTFFLSVLGVVFYIRWKYKWLIGYSFFMAILFMVINYFSPENFSKTLMPALQSYWFVPHVIVYILAYAVLAVSAIIGLKGLWALRQNTETESVSVTADNVVYMGFSLLTFGLLFGALWAKEAWGHYWTWDPKETWAFITWLFYLIYIHLRLHFSKKPALAFWILALAFVALLICWFGVNYLPSAANSVHTYTNA